MNIVELLTDAVYYPINNIAALIVYGVLSIVATLVLVLTGVGSFSAEAANNAFASGGIAFIGIVIFILILFLIDGYALDIIKYGIERSEASPSIDVVRQVLNGIKLFIVNVVYYIIPVLLTVIIGFVSPDLAYILGLILFIIFALAEFMAECRLANSESLSDALSIGEAISDISRVGIVKLLVTIVAIFVVAFVIGFIITLIGGLSDIVGSILMGIFSIYMIFVSKRATGLLYSDAR